MSETSKKHEDLQSIYEELYGSSERKCTVFLTSGEKIIEGRMPLVVHCYDDESEWGKLCKFPSMEDLFEYHTFEELEKEIERLKITSN